MTVYFWLIAALWIVLVAYWAIAAIGTKRTLSAPSRWREAGLRLSIVLIVIVAVRNPGVRQFLRNAHAHAPNNMGAGVIGVVLCALGIGLAIWARAYLGRNWGMPMSRKENPELVTTGPYAFVRHPIYGGIILAMLGTTIGGAVFWVLPLVLFSAYFIYSARREEKLMLAQFPQQYPAYRRRTKMLVPFVL